MKRLWLLILLIIPLYASPNPAQAQTCPDAPPPRLHVGQAGVVAAGIDRLRLRALPAVGTGEVRVLYAGTPFTVLAGPSCNGGYIWWRIQLDGTEVTGWAAEGDWTRYYLAPAGPVLVCESGWNPWAYALLSRLCWFFGW